MMPSTVPCVFCGTPTPFRATAKCNNCYEVTKRLEDFLKSNAGRQHVAAQLLIGDLARAVIDMDNLAFSEGLIGPGTPGRLAAWAALLKVAETVEGKRAASTSRRLNRESQKS